VTLPKTAIGDDYDDAREKAWPDFCHGRQRVFRATM
jgi:hypothetical protein